MRRQSIACVSLLTSLTQVQPFLLPRPGLAPRTAGQLRTPRFAHPRLRVSEDQLTRPESKCEGADDEEHAPPDSVTAASALVSSALLAEGVQLAGTALLLYLAQRYTETSSPVEAVSHMISYTQELGLTGYCLFAALLVFLQVVPIAAAFVLTLSAGAIFGAVKGTLVVLSCSTISASISFMISRSFGRQSVLEAAAASPQFKAIDGAFANASFSTSLTLITLLRLSPLLPFAWANYVFGLSPVPLAAFSVGTFVGCFPAVAGYVSAGQLGAEMVVNGAEANPLVLGIGILATVGAISVAGNIANEALKDMDIDL
mmetsp:Transcript_31107/g.65185  ORF Transcript_31107/g.65185 Transcript_31107/m.65185 type:complete len:315 (-) Transcript_31107:224-1168(-)